MEFWKQNKDVEITMYYQISIFNYFFSISHKTLFYLKQMYEGCSKWIAYFYLETSNFKWAQKYSFHALEVLPLARNAKFQPMYPLLEASRYADLGTVIRYWWMADPSACRDWYFHPARNAFNFGNKKKSGLGNTGGEAKQLLFLSSKTP